MLLSPVLAARSSCPSSRRAARNLSARPGALAAGLLALLAAPGCRLPASTLPGEASNVVVFGSIAYVALSSNGIGVYSVPDGALLRRVAPAAGSESVDDLALADGFLFALDATAPGYLSVLSLSELGEPVLVSGPLEVPVGPFSGVAAACGIAIVSGGTSELTVARYNARGALAAERSLLDLGRGQPDVLISPDGEHAFVSTHFSLLGGTFGLTALELAAPPADSTVLAELILDGAGFSPGGARPANFPLEMALSGESLLVAFGGGLAVIDVADPAVPRLLSTLPLDLAAVSVDANAARAAVVGSSPAPALVFVDVSDPSAPRIEARVELPAGSRPLGVACAEDCAFVAGPGVSLEVVPVPGQPSAPRTRGEPRRASTE